MPRKPFTGQLGESLLDSYCSEQRIVCTPPGRDTMGWDRMLEWLDDDEDGAWDKREERYRAFVQVKEDHSGNGKVEINPSTFRELVLAEDPAFLLVVLVKRGVISRVRLLHVWKRECERVLARLRARDTRPFKLSTTRATIEICDSNVFFNELRRHIGANLNSYRARKRAMIRSLGYSSSPFSVKFTAEGTEIDGLVDLFLGLRPSADVAISPLIETRFGIDVPFGPGKQDGESRASLTMLDFPHLRKTFWLTGDDGEGCVESVEVEGKILNPLSIGFVLPLSHLKWRFVSDQLEFVASSHEFNFTARAMPDELAMADLPTWRRVRQIFLGAKVIRLAARSLPPLEFQHKAALTEDEILYFQSLRDACEVASGITLPPSQMIQPEALYRQRDKLAVMAALLKRDGRQLLPAMEKDHPPGTIVGAVFYLTARFGEADGLIAGKVEAVVTTTGGLAAPSVRFDICQYYVGSVPDEIRASAVTMLNAHKADLKAKGVYLGQVASHALR